MASPTSAFTTFTELVTTTYRNHKKEVADNVSNHNALFRRLTQKGRIRREDGGLSVVEPLEYAENSTYTRYSGYDPLNVEAVDVLTSAEYTWCQVSRERRRLGPRDPLELGREPHRELGEIQDQERAEVDGERSGLGPLQRRFAVEPARGPAVDHRRRRHRARSVASPPRASRGGRTSCSPRQRRCRAARRSRRDRPRSSR